jgi:WD40 repeat protein
MLSELADGDLFVGSDGYGITVWDPETRRRVFRMKSSVHVFGLKAFPRGQLVAVRSEVGVSVIDLNNGEVRRTWPVAPGLPYIDVSPDGSQILVGSGRGVAVYNTDGSLVREEGTDGERVITAVFHPKSGHVVAGTETGQVVHLGSKVS